MKIHFDEDWVNWKSQKRLVGRKGGERESGKRKEQRRNECGYVMVFCVKDSGNPLSWHGGGAETLHSIVGVDAVAIPWRKSLAPNQHFQRPSLLFCSSQPLFFVPQLLSTFLGFSCYSQFLSVFYSVRPSGIIHQIILRWVEFIVGPKIKK